MPTLIPKGLPEENAPRVRSSAKNSAKLHAKLSRGKLLISPQPKHTMRIFPVLCLGSIVLLAIKNSQNQNRQLLSFRNGMLNSIKVKEWRRSVISSCKAAESAEDMEDVKKLSREFTSSVHENESFLNLDLHPEYWVQRCPFVFVDLGSGIGDTVGEFIDAGLEGCMRSEDDTEGFDPMHFDVDTGNFAEYPGSRAGEKNEDFTQWVKKRIDSFYPGLGPEDYCVFGCEANPLLKTDLMKLERHINRLEPRPLRHLHFFTETAIHSEDNVTKPFYIDSVHNNEKYPGSTLFENNKDIREAVDKFKDTITYDMKTMTLSTLIKNTMSFFKETDSNDPVNYAGDANFTDPPYKAMEALSRQHLILYVDIEGSEFHVLNEAVDSGVLCSFMKDNDNRLDIFIQYHSPELMNIHSPSAKRFTEEVRPKLLQCGGENIHLEERMKYFDDEES